MNLPSPAQREIITTFLQEACEDVHVDGVSFLNPPSGMAMKVHYRDAKGNTRHKTIINPEANSRSDLEDMVVLASEWLSHPDSKAIDRAKVTVQ